MRVKLKVLEGSSAGMEIPINHQQYLIGRAEECQLRPRSDTVSRKHALIFIKDGKVGVQDLKSRNGVVINGERIEKKTRLRDGDTLQIGKLVFQVVIDHALGGDKKPKVKDVKDAAVRTAGQVIEAEDVNSWLEEADEADRERRLVDPETRHFRLEETDRVKVGDRPAPVGDSEKTVQITLPKEEGVKEGDSGEHKTPEKKTPGKLPKLPSTNSKDSREAATQMLKKFFNNR